jgi:hypothetical protein
MADFSLANVATFFGLHGTIDVGTFDGTLASGTTVPYTVPAWAGMLKLGLESLERAGNAASVEATTPGPASGSSSSTTAAATGSDWVVAPASTTTTTTDSGSTPKIDWKAVLTSFGMPLFSRTSSASRSQPNISDFKTEQPKKSDSA